VLTLLATTIKLPLGTKPRFMVWGDWFLFIYYFFYSTLGHKEEFIDLIPLRGFYLFILWQSGNHCHQSEKAHINKVGVGLLKINSYRLQLQLILIHKSNSKPSHIMT
jgi:hypothetical protein